MRRINRFLLFIFLTSSAVYAGPLESCKEYTRYGVPGNNGDILCRKGYLLAHDSERKTPIWVAEHLTSERANATRSRSNAFKADPNLKRGRRAELSDYKNSGFDRGHMAPSADMRWDAQAMKESFYLSNMVPQVPDMNQHIWKDLEEKVRNWAIERGELYIYTGPIYAEGMEHDTIGANNVSVPTHIYKIIFDPVQLESVAFIMPNSELDPADMPGYIVSIREVEQQTGLDFLSKLSKRRQDMIEIEKAPDLWQ